MQIEQIALYHHDGRRRMLEFELDNLNIVTGVPRRGKSALLEIVDYCLGREEYTVPDGKVRDVASWYGVAVVHRGGRTWLLRPVLPSGRESTSSQMLIVDAPREPPAHPDLVANADRGAVRQHLSRRLGVESGELPRGEGRLKQPLRVSVAQAVLLCLQGRTRSRARPVCSTARRRRTSRTTCGRPCRICWVRSTRRRRRCAPPSCSPNAR